MATLDELRTAVTTLRQNCKDHHGSCSECMFKIGGDCTLTYTPEYWEDPVPRIAFTAADKAAAKMCSELGYDTIKIEHKDGVRISTAVAWNTTKAAFVLPPELFENFDVDIVLSIKTIMNDGYVPVTYSDILKQPVQERDIIKSKLKNSDHQITIDEYLESVNTCVQAKE